MDNTEKIKSIYLRCLEDVYNVLDIFNNFFGEEYVDMQDVIDFSTFKRSFLNIGVFNLGIPDRVLEENNIVENINLGSINDEVLNTLLDHIYIEEVLDSYLFRTITPITILVHFPKVKVVNEFDKSVEITHLYVKILITYDGKLKERFRMNRAEYTATQFESNYMHSHISSIPKNNLTEFQRPCLGSGPIVRTCESLYSGYNVSLWNLFCLELSKYVETESISGTPYHRLERIGNTSLDFEYEDLKGSKFLLLAEQYKSLIRDFIIHVIKNKILKFNYINNAYNIALSTKDFALLLSNEFIKWYNKSYNEGLYNKDINSFFGNYVLVKRIIKENGIYKTQSSDYNTNFYINKRICDFKGKEIKLRITELDNNIYEESILLNYKIVAYIRTLILNTVNNYYGKSENNTVDTKTLFL